jgi:hypothetical protein
LAHSLLLGSPTRTPEEAAAFFSRLEISKLLKFGDSTDTIKYTNTGRLWYDQYKMKARRPPAFHANHPLWDQILDFRQPPHAYTYEQLSSYAKQQGYDLSPRQIETGLASAPLIQRFPQRNPDWLRHDYGQIQSLDPIEAMTQIIIDSIAYLHGDCSRDRRE